MAAHLILTGLGVEEFQMENRTNGPYTILVTVGVDTNLIPKWYSINHLIENGSPDQGCYSFINPDPNSMTKEEYYTIMKKLAEIRDYNNYRGLMYKDRAVKKVVADSYSAAMTDVQTEFEQIIAYLDKATPTPGWYIRNKGTTDEKVMRNLNLLDKILLC